MTTTSGIGERDSNWISHRPPRLSRSHGLHYHRMADGAIPAPSRAILAAFSSGTVVKPLWVRAWLMIPATFCDQRYPRFQISLPCAMRVILPSGHAHDCNATHPELDLQIAIDRRSMAPQQPQGRQSDQHDALGRYVSMIIAIATFASLPTISKVVGPLLDPGVASSLVPTAAAAAGLSSLLDPFHQRLVHASCTSSPVRLALVSLAHHCVRRRRWPACGFAALADQLLMTIGSRATAAGACAPAFRIVVEICVEEAISRAIRHELRWLRTIRTYARWLHVLLREPRLRGRPRSLWRRQRAGSPCSHHRPYGASCTLQRPPCPLALKQLWCAAQ